MSDLAARLDAVIDKLRVNLESQASLQKEISLLKQRTGELEKENILLKEQKQEIEENTKIIKLVKSLDLAEEDREVLKKKLKYYIREIDKCLSNINA